MSGYRSDIIAVQELRGGLLESDSWDVLVAHYLGVDHAGHTYSVASPQMARKVAQMDAEISDVRPLSLSCLPGTATCLSHVCPSPCVHVLLDVISNLAPGPIAACMHNARLHLTLTPGARCHPLVENCHLTDLARAFRYRMLGGVWQTVRAGGWDVSVGFDTKLHTL